VEATASSVFPWVTGNTDGYPKCGHSQLPCSSLKSHGWYYKFFTWYNSSCPYSELVNHLPFCWLSSTCCQTNVTRQTHR